jgi:drug/metabolite transporter (DMT)-like permease
VARTLRIVLGAILVLVGAVWFLQGVDVIQGSFMTGAALWAVIGAVCVVAGIVVLRGPRRVG